MQMVSPTIFLCPCFQRDSLSISFCCSFLIVLSPMKKVKSGAAYGDTGSETIGGDEAVEEGAIGDCAVAAAPDSDEEADPDNSDT